jgi:DNA-binding NarL/FixJ family response regulator
MNGWINPRTGQRATARYLPLNACIHIAPMNPQQREAHLRMLETLPKRTHACEEEVSGRGIPLRRSQKERIMELLKLGWKHERIAVAVGISPATVSRYKTGAR